MLAADVAYDRITLPATVGELAWRREVLDADTTCGRVELIFGAHPSWGSLVICRPDEGLTLLDRDRFMARMSGRLGYGRALFHRQPVQRLAGEPPIAALAESATLQAAAAAALERSDANLYDDLLVELADGGVATLAVADLFATLSHVHGHSAMHDPLTGLPNRQLLLDRLQNARARALRHGGEFAVLFIDLDDFKNVNDSLGHAAGDEVLVAVAERLLTTVRAHDTVARLGGDEFAILQADGGTDSAHATAARILHALSEPVVAAGRRLTVNPSIGIGVGTASTPAELVLRDADLAMYRAKRAGKRRSAVCDPSLHADAISRLELKADLERVCDRGELYLVYQPVVALGDRRVTGVEALLRWRHPEHGVLAPGAFIALAEETGAIVPIGRWVLEEACRQVRRWQDSSPLAAGLLVGVNVSPRQLEQPRFPADVAAALRAAGLDPQRLVVELTEGVVLGDLDSARDRLTSLRRLGARIAVDDFGSGFTSLSYLRRLPIDFLKIDRSFTADIATDPQARRLLDGLLRLGESLQVTCVAEGVETREQLDVLDELGCTRAQGFLLSRPLDAEDVLGVVAAGGGSV